MPGEKAIRWNEATRETIMAARQSLVDEGMERPTIRSTLYKLLKLQGWSKKHYNTLCRRLGKWRDQGLVEYGLFSDDGAGDAYHPMTEREIAERLAALKDAIPAHLEKDGILRVVFVEHIGMVDQIASWLDYRVPVVSSQGQLRRENLYSAASEWFRILRELHGVGVLLLGLVDYDRGGDNIYRAHERWLRHVFPGGRAIITRRVAVTRDQVRAADLPVNEDHQFDGWVAAYGVARFREELRRMVR